MRALIAAAVLAGCATPCPAPTPAERVAGCWINRDAGAVTMRWLPDRAHPNVLVGAKTSYGIAGANNNAHYTLAQTEAGWNFCELRPAGAGEAQCWRVAEGQEGPLDGGRAFIDAHGDGLRISVLGAGEERLIFQGRRDGCD
jgi:hypothetical protein